MEQSIINLVGSLGFPIFTAVYFMTRLEKHMQKNNELLAILVKRETRENG